MYQSSGLKSVDRIQLKVRPLVQCTVATILGTYSVHNDSARGSNFEVAVFAISDAAVRRHVTCCCQVVTVQSACRESEQRSEAPSELNTTKLLYSHAVGPIWRVTYLHTERRGVLWKYALPRITACGYSAVHVRAREHLSAQQQQRGGGHTVA